MVVRSGAACPGVATLSAAWATGRHAAPRRKSTSTSLLVFRMRHQLNFFRILVLICVLFDRTGGLDLSLVSDGREHRSMSRHIVVMQFESPTSNICSRGRFSVGVRNVCCLLHFFLFTRVMSSRWEVGLLLVTGLPGAVPGPGPENIAGASLACWRSGSVWGTCEAGQCQAGCQGGNAVGPGEAAFCQAGKAVGQGGAACCRAVSAVGQGGAACRPLGAGSSDGK
jgi:hypothetical protein